MSRRSVAVLALALLSLRAAVLWGDAEPVRRHLRPSLQRVRGGKKAKKKPPPPILARGRWLPGVRASLDRLMREEGSGSKGYSAQDPPAAVIAFDDVAVEHSAGEELFHWLVDSAALKLDQGAWGLIPEVYGRERIRAGHKGFVSDPPSVWPVNPYYRMYRKSLYSCYRSIFREQGKAAGARWSAALLVGYREEEIRSIAKDKVEASLRGRFGTQPVEESAGDARPIDVRVGLRTIPEMEDLFLKLKKHGFDVWVLSSSNQWSAEAFAGHYGVHPSRVIGIRVQASSGTLTGVIQDPVPVGAGMAEAVSLNIGKSPALIIGGEGDLELLKFGKGLRIRMAAGIDPRWLSQAPF